MSGWLTRAELAGYTRLVRPALFRWAHGDAEAIHESMIEWLSRLPATRRVHEANPVEIAGIRFPNRVGVAAGLDKNGHAAAAWTRLGFGFAELGTVTGQAQPGNPKPRLFRAKASQGVINRMGFNNDGAEALADRLLKLGVQRGNLKLGIPLGVSIGKTKVAPLEQALADYLISVEALAPYADYFAVNVSSPNTPDLRALQGALELERLLAGIVAEASRGTGADPVPVFVKLAPDMEPEQVRESLAVINASGAAGIIATNTTLHREGLAPEDQHLADETGGLSGAPLTRRALAFVEKISSATELSVIGVGGIMTPRDAVRMVDAGASLLQLYTGFIYAGPALVRGINEALRYRP